MSGNIPEQKLRYDEMVQKLLDNLDLTAYREKWGTTTNTRIWHEGGCLMRTNCDWPIQFYPSNEDTQAADWIIMRGSDYIKKYLHT